MQNFNMVHIHILWGLYEDCLLENYVVDNEHE